MGIAFDIFQEFGNQPLPPTLEPFLWVDGRWLNFEGYVVVSNRQREILFCAQEATFENNSARWFKPVFFQYNWVRSLECVYISDYGGKVVSNGNIPWYGQNLLHTFFIKGDFLRCRRDYYSCRYRCVADPTINYCETGRPRRYPEPSQEYYDWKSHTNFGTPLPEPFHK